MTEGVDDGMIEEAELSRVRSVLNAVQGWLSESEAVELYLLAKNQPMNGNLLEVGCWKGRSTICMALGVKDGGRSDKLYTIDSFEGGPPADFSIYIPDEAARAVVENSFHENIRRFEVEGIITLVKARSRDTLPEGDKWKPVRLAFVDGLHDYENAKFDIINCGRLLEPNGIITIHDSRDAESMSNAVRDTITTGEWLDKKYIDSILEAIKK